MKIRYCVFLLPWGVYYCEDLTANKKETLKTCDKDEAYCYAWAEREKKAAYPERFAQEALGHNSKAVHRANTHKAQVELPPLGEYEKRRPMFVGDKMTEPVVQAVSMARLDRDCDQLRRTPPQAPALHA